MKIRISSIVLGLALALGGVSSPALAAGKEIKLLNVSYDPTRELYEEINTAFAKQWKEKTGDTVVISQSHGGSGKQGRAIVDGLDADVATLALAYDTDQLYKKGGLIPKAWQSKLPHNSAPYTSTIVFVVRKGNPQNIKDWDDLVKPGVSIITPNPKTSGGARWNYLAAWAFALKKFNGDEAQVQAFIRQLYKNVAVLDTGARGSTTTFVERGIGDVLLSWENEAFLAEKEIGKGSVEIVVPSLSILAEPPVTVVDQIAKKHGTQEVAKSYLEFLYSDEGQDIIGKNFYRPVSEKASQKYAGQFAKTELVTIADFGGWDKTQAKHFADGGVFDKIYLT